MDRIVFSWGKGPRWFYLPFVVLISICFIYLISSAQTNSLVGKWRTKEDQYVITLQLNSDNTYTLGDQYELVERGKYQIKQTTLHFKPEEGERYLCKFKMEDKKLLIWFPREKSPVIFTQISRSEKIKDRQAEDGKGEKRPVSQEFTDVRDKFTGIEFKMPKGWRYEVFPNTGLICVCDTRTLQTAAFFWPLVDTKRESSFQQCLQDIDRLFRFIWKGYRVTRRVVAKGDDFASSSFVFEYKHKYEGLMIISRMVKRVVISGYFSLSTRIKSVQDTLFKIVKSFKVYKRPCETKLNAAGRYFILTPAKGWRVETLDPGNINIWGDKKSILAGLWSANIPENPLYAETGPNKVWSPYMKPAKFIQELAPRIFPDLSEAKVVRQVPVSEFDQDMITRLNIEERPFDAAYLDLKYTFKDEKCIGSYLVMTFPSTQIGRLSGAPYWLFVIIGGGAPADQYETYRGTLSAIINSIKVNWKLAKRLDEMELEIRKAEMESSLETWKRHAEVLGGLERLRDPNSGEVGLYREGPYGAQPWTKDGKEIIWSKERPGPGYYTMQRE